MQNNYQVIYETISTLLLQLHRNYTNVFLFIFRLKKEKADIDQCNSENVNKAAELMQTLEELNVKSKEYLDTINSLNDVKQSLEV